MRFLRALYIVKGKEFEKNNGTITNDAAIYED